MFIIWIILLLVLGLVLLIKSADYFVDSAVKIAESARIPKMIIGATIVSLATTLPETFTSLSALFTDSSEASDMAIGNALGSCIFNTAVILSIVAIFMSGNVEKKNIMEKVFVLGLSFITLWIFSLDGIIIWYEGLIQLLLVIFYIIVNVISTKQYQNTHNDNVILKNKTKTLVINLLILSISAVGIYYGAKLLVANAVKIAEITRVSGRIISITIMSIGTSLPELTTTITSVIKKEKSLSIGNILGANILNLTLVLGSCGVFAQNGLKVQNIIRYLDLPLLFGVLSIFVVPIIVSGKLKKWQGVLGLVTYICYMIFLLINI